MTIAIKKVNDGVTEKDIESYLVKEIIKLGGTAYKFSSPAKRSVPDRLCVLPKRLIVFVECKRPKMVPSKAQAKEIQKLKDLGHWATWVSTKQEVDVLINNIMRKLDAKI